MTTPCSLACIAGGIPDDCLLVWVTARGRVEDGARFPPSPGTSVFSSGGVAIKRVRKSMPARGKMKANSGC